MFVDLIFLFFKDSLAITLMLQPNDNNNNNDKLDNDSNVNLYAVDNMTCYL